MRKSQLVVSALLLVLLLAACAPKAAQAPAPTPQAAAAAPAPAAPVAKALAKQAWEAEWEKTLEAAKKEGSVVVQAMVSTYRPYWAAAMQAYGVKLELLAGRAPDLAPRVLAERRAGIYSCDIFQGGTTTPLISMKPKGAFDPMDSAFILPEVADPKVWYQGRFPFADSDHTLFMYTLFLYPALGINTNLVKPGEIKSYNDVLDPKWLGKIVILDPAQGGTGESFVGVIGSQVMGWDYIRKLVENKPILLRDEHQRLEWLAQGKVALSIAPQSVELETFRKIGAPVAPVIPVEGGWLSAGTAGMALYNRAAHPNAAKVYINWLLTKEGQTISSRVSGSQSARVDVPTDFLDPVFVRDPYKKYFIKDTEEYLTTKQDENRPIIRELFKDLLK